MLKRIVSFMVVMVMLFAFVSCVGEDDKTNLLDTYKNDAKSDLDTYVENKGIDNYSEENWALVLQALEDGKAAIDEAADRAEVDVAFKAAKYMIDEVTERDNKKLKVASIHFFMTSFRAGPAWQDHKYYNFTEQTYSTKRMVKDEEKNNYLWLVDSDEWRKIYGEPWEYTIRATFTEEKATVFFKDIKVIGIFDLDEYYFEEADDGLGWNLIITFDDGTIFESMGNNAFPEQRDALNGAFLSLTGYQLFSWIASDLDY